MVGELPSQDQLDGLLGQGVPPLDPTPSGSGAARLEHQIPPVNPPTLLELAGNAWQRVDVSRLIMRLWGHLALVGLAAWLGGCSSSDVDKAAPAALPADESLKISFLVPDFGPLAATGLTPDVGDPKAQLDAYVKLVNREGGIAGRRIDARYHWFNPIDDATMRAACIAATEDDHAFVVIGLPATTTAQMRCVAEEHATLMVSFTGLSAALARDTEGRAFSVSMSVEASAAAWARVLDERGDLDGHKIGVVTGDYAVDFDAAVDDGLLPELRRLGYDPTLVRLPCESVLCEQHSVAVQRLRKAGVDFVFDALGPGASPPFVGAAQAVGWSPTWTMWGDLVTDEIARFHQASAAALAGTVGLSETENIGEVAGAKRCADAYADAGGDPLEPNSSPYGFAAIGCSMLDLVAQAADDANSLDQQHFISAFERIRDGGYEPTRPLTFAPDEHDGNDWVILRSYDASVPRWAPIDAETWRDVRHQR